MAFAIILTLLSASLLIAAIATVHWVDVNVDRQALQAAAMNSTELQVNISILHIYQDHGRGLFKTCYTANTTLNMLDNFEDGKFCKEEKGFSLSDYGDSKYTLRNHLLRSSVAFFLISVLFMFISLIVALLGCCQGNMTMIKATGVMELFAAVSDAFGIVIFNGVHFLETTKISILDFPATWKTKHSLLDQHSSIKFGYSYALGWLSIVLGVIAAILYFVGISSKRSKQRKILSNRGSIYKNFYLSSQLDDTLKGSGRPGSRNPYTMRTEEEYYNNTFQRNRAYDMLNKPTRSSYNQAMKY